MKTIGVISATLLIVSAITGYVFSFLYLFRSEFMPYHSVALGASWEEVAGPYQVLILALMKVEGGGWLGVSVTITFMIREYIRTGRLWPVTASLVAGLGILLPTLYAIWWVKSHSAAEPPWYAALGVILLLIAAWWLALLRRSGGTSSQ